MRTLNDEALFSRLADEARNYPVIDDPNEQMLMDITSAYQTTLAAVQVTLFSSLSGGAHWSVQPWVKVSYSVC